MYKLLLCVRYLRTRYIALASIISVTLGVATMIVVNAVMAGFTSEMQDRIHGILADVVVEARSLSGFPDAARHMEQIRTVAGEHIEQMTPIVQVPAMLSFEFNGQWISRPVQLVGVDGQTQSQTSDFGKYLQHPANRQRLSWQLQDGGYDVRSPQAAAESPQRSELAQAGWPYRRRWAAHRQWLQGHEPSPQAEETRRPQSINRLAPPGEGDPAAADDPFARSAPPLEAQFDPAREQYTGLVLGIALANLRLSDGSERFLLLPGDDVKLTFPTAGTPPQAVSESFTIVDFYESRMSEYDSQLVFVPIDAVQRLRGMIDPTTGIGAVTSIQIKLKPGRDGDLVRDKIRAIFPPELYAVETWRDKQGPLLAAVQMETAILNVLLFLIITVAGFGILAIFFMIVVEKTRDIGILKSLGAGSGGVMSIFLSYGLSLGLVGAGLGLGIGLLLVAYINQIADLLGRATGRKVFDPSIYYFYEIPAIVHPWTVSWIVLGAMAIAVLASILPARRAARLRPVEALRYE